MNSLSKMLPIYLIGFAAIFFASEGRASILDNGEAIHSLSMGRVAEPALRLALSEAEETDYTGQWLPHDQNDPERSEFFEELRSSRATTTTSTSFGSSTSPSGVILPSTGIEASPRTHAVWREIGRFMPDAPESWLLRPPQTVV